MAKKSDNKMVCCGTALMKVFKDLGNYTQESQKKDLLNFVHNVFTTENVPQDYANEILDNLENKNVKYGVIYLGDIVMKGMKLGVIK